MGISIFDVLRIELDPCHFEKLYGSKHKKYHRPVLMESTWMVKLRKTLIDSHNNSQKHPIFTKRVECNCFCKSAEKNNQKLIENLREEISKQLGLSGDEENEDAE